MTFETPKANLVAFEEQHLAAMKELARMDARKKKLEEQIEEAKRGIMSAMETYGVTGFSNDILTISYVPENTIESIDLKQLQNNEPELYEDLLRDYRKVSKRQAYVRFSFGKNKK